MQSIDWIYSTRGKFIGVTTVVWTAIMALTFGPDMMGSSVVKWIFVVLLALVSGAVVAAVLWWLLSVLDPKRYR